MRTPPQPHSRKPRLISVAHAIPVPPRHSRESGNPRADGKKGWPPLREAQGGARERSDLAGMPAEAGTPEPPPTRNGNRRHSESPHAIPAPSPSFPRKREPKGGREEGMAPLREAQGGAETAHAAPSSGGCPAKAGKPPNNPQQKSKTNTPDSRNTILPILQNPSHPSSQPSFYD